jgi:hypothetical protein
MVVRWSPRHFKYYTAETANAALDGAGHLAITVRRPGPRLATTRYAGCHYIRVHMP